MSLKQRVLFFVILLIVPLIFIWSFQKKYISYQGSVMGTTFSVKCYSPIWISKVKIINEINTSFTFMNSIFSTWIPDSEISLINKVSSNVLQVVSDPFLDVFNLSIYLNDLSAGAFDPSIKPVIDLWGFNNKNSYYKIPSQSDIYNVSSFIGLSNFVIQDKNIFKKHDNVTLDLSSIAKGYAVDYLSTKLKALNIKNFMIELGGEVIVSTPPNKSKSSWKLGIVSPHFNYSNQELFVSLNLKNKALATSGDYRNYFVEDDVPYTHIFDPLSLRPIRTNIASVSVIADTCALADGLATAIMVLGKERGIALVEALDNVEAMIIERVTFDEFLTYYSSNFNQYINN